MVETQLCKLRGQDSPNTKASCVVYFTAVLYTAVLTVELCTVHVVCYVLCGLRLAACGNICSWYVPINSVSRTGEVWFRHVVGQTAHFGDRTTSTFEHCLQRRWRLKGRLLTRSYSNRGHTQVTNANTYNQCAEEAFHLSLFISGWPQSPFHFTVVFWVLS